MQTLKPTRTLVEQAYATILDAICDGTLAPGERLTQDEIAARLQVSRQPVMSALALLKQQGFLVEHGRRGLMVAPVDPARFAAIYQLRSALDPLAARLAAERVTALDATQGQALIERGRALAAAGDGKALLQADVDFHRWIYALSGNPLLAESMDLHWQHLRRAMGEVLRRPALSAAVWDEHARILEALLARRAALAAALMQQHVTTAYERVSAEQRERPAPALAPAPPGLPA